eukprot:TRINITY_DN27126_c0_g1_i1.p1 TRINITY_DN27126_c0_g1~~TRINITY_DN27126_c0_g1_i1.p1  ORF type:complete len:394 (+),score=110.70 TRINITY_DN27126_c0_g1_i1:173-1354(+)
MNSSQRRSQVSNSSRGGSAAEPDMQQLHSKIDKLVELVSRQTHELRQLKETQDELRMELGELRQDQADLREHAKMPSGPSASRASTSPGSTRSPSRSLAAKDDVQLDLDSSQEMSPSREQEAARKAAGEAGDVQETHANSPSRTAAPRSAQSVDMMKADDIRIDAKKGGLYGLAYPLLKFGCQERVRQQALKRVAAALSKGASPHSWNGPGTPLMTCVKARSIELVQALLDAKGDPDEHDDKGVSLLHRASFDGQVEIGRLLIEYKCDPNIEDRFGQTPMFFAPTRGVCELLYQAYADLNTLSHSGQSALHLAARAGLADVLSWLAGRVTQALLCLRDDDGHVCLEYAEKAGCKPEVLISIEGLARGGMRGLKLRQKGKGSESGRSLSPTSMR